MSRDIRSYFTSKTIGKEKSSRKEVSVSTTQQRKRLILVDSDSDESSNELEVKVSKKQKLANSSEKKKEESALKPVTASDVFGSDHIKRSAEKTVPVISTPEAKKSTRKEKAKKNDVSLEDELDVCWEKIDEVESQYWTKEKLHPNTSDTVGDTDNQHNNKHLPHSSQKLKLSVCNESPTKKKKVSDDADQQHDKSTSSKLNSHPHNVTPKSKNKTVGFESEKTPKTKRIKHGSDDGDDSTSKHKRQKHSEMSNHSEDQDAGAMSSEKKKEHAMNYIRYLNREGPKHHGSKVIPEGSPDCLKGLVFVITGVLDSLDREEALELIKKYGGRVTSSLSRNTSYLIVGEEAGPSKLEKAKALNLKQLDEDGLLNLIIQLSEKNDNIPKKETKEKGKEDDFKKGEHKKMENAEEKSSDCLEETKKNSPVGGTLNTHVRPMSAGHSSISTDNKSKASVSHHKPQNILEDRDAVPPDMSRPSLWVEKYKPTSTKQIIGQQGEKSVVKKLSKWLENWHKNRSGGKKFKPSPWAKDDDGSYYKAALISGPPGIGKTTTAHLVSKELGFDFVEFNASDTRSKKLLHDEVTEMLSSQSLQGLFNSGKLHSKTRPANHVLIMDEVDGMAGNEDRGGIQELIQLIKTTHIPIICICNDRNHPKIRSLVNYCFDLRLQKPRVEQIRGAMMSVCFKEGLKISPDALIDVITCANQDIRQTLNNLSMWAVSTKSLSTADIKSEAHKAKKEFKLGPWDVLRKVFSTEEHKNMSIHDKSDLFFYDYNISPLFVQENYLNVVPASAAGNINKSLELISATADSISYGDTIEKAIRSTNSWSLLPTQAMFSSVFPGEYMCGYIKSQINFPAWLGKNSRANKFDRLFQELHVHMRLAISGSKLDLALDYISFIRDAIVKPLITEGVAGIPSALDVLRKYYLLREDLESLLELSLWPNQKDPMSLVESKVKAALTRAYNKEGVMIPYAVHTNVKKKAGAQVNELEIGELEDNSEEEDEGKDDIKLDGMIKIAKKKNVPAETSLKGTEGKKNAGGKKGIEAKNGAEVKKGKGRGKNKAK